MLGEVVARFAEVSTYNGSQVYIAGNEGELFEVLLRIIEDEKICTVVAANVSEHVNRSILDRLSRLTTVHNLDGLKSDRMLEVANEADAGLVCASAGLAEIGGIIMINGDALRIASTLPKYLIAILPSKQIINSYDELAGYLRSSYRAGRNIFFITGPSGTADIELAFVRGVHGPSKLYVLIANW